MKMSPQIEAIRKAIQVANYDELCEIIRVAEGNRKILENRRKEEGWAEVRNVLMKYITQFGSIEATNADGDLITIDLSCDFQTIGQINAPDW